MVGDVTIEIAEPEPPAELAEEVPKEKKKTKQAAPAENGTSDPEKKVSDT